MAHLWVRDEAERWAVLPLDHNRVSLSARPPRPILHPFSEDDSQSSVLLVRTRIAEVGPWVLIARAASRVTINGNPLATGIRVVTDRDRIRVSCADDVYYSSESIARVEDFPGLDQISFCPRCKQEIKRSESAVKCPSCEVWHHQTDLLNCWAYADVCALCTQQTDLNTGFRWTPEEEE